MFRDTAAWPGWGRTFEKNSEKLPTDPRRASTPMVVSTWARVANWCDSCKANAPAAVEKAVPLRTPSASLGR